MFLIVSALVLGALSALVVFWPRISRSGRLTSRIPGPTPLPVIGNAREFGSNTVEILANIGRLWKQYGTMFRVWIGPKLFIVLSDPKEVEVILSSTTQITKNVSYRFLYPWLGTGLLTSTGKKWHTRRKIITPTFHFKILEEFVDVFNTNGDILIKKLQKEVNGPEFDIYNYVTLCALDIICETAMGVGVNAQDNSSSEYVIAVQKLADIIIKRTFRPWLHPSFIFDQTELGKEQRHYLNVLHTTTNNVIKKRREELLKQNEKKSEKTNEGDFGEKKRMALLDLLLQCSQNGTPLSNDDIREETDTFMFEGHDTTASGISFCLYLLSQHQDVQEKAVQEIREVIGDSDRHATFRDLQELKYLERVLKEAQRIYPSVPAFARELDDDIQLGGHTLPAGTNIMIMEYYMNKHPGHFPDPDKFNPDRFLPENCEGRHPYAYVPFSAGPRNCVGQKFAMLEMKATVSKILRHYKLLPSEEPLVLSIELVLRSSTGVKVKLVPRK
ncbi:cytochrome P450 4C1 [Anabrus simplex]|uniref:cytochrome P450 4C1 n=1 Tax=Anabrus simplex TaxID=316456 RepID=UPI0035A30D05